MKYRAVTERQDLASSLRGQKLRVPRLDRVFADWPTTFNPNLETLRQSVDERLQRLVNNRYKHRSERALALKKLQVPNYALLGAYYWPFVDVQLLEILTYMAIWIALWDDVFESEAGSFEAGTLANDWEASQTYRYQTMLFIRQSLQLSSGSYQRRPDNVFITSFEDIALHVNSMCSTEQKERLYAQIENHILATAKKQLLKLSPHLPNLSDYLDCRMGTSGIQVCTTLLDICWDRSFSASLRDDPRVQKLLDQVNIMIVVTNDMCSLKAKLGRGNVDNLLALLWPAHSCLDSAVSIAASTLEAAKDDFEETSEELLAKYCDGSAAQRDLEELIGACRAVCTGNLIWSLSTRRYDLHRDDKSQSQTIVL